MSFLFENSDFEETRRLLRGEETLPPWREKLRLQVSKRFKINVINVVYDRILTGTPRERPRLDVVVELEDDWMRIRKDRFSIKYHVTKSIRKQFAEVAREFGLEHHAAIENLHVVSTCFSREAIVGYVDQFFANDRDMIFDRFSKDGIWKIEGGPGMFSLIVVFFLDEATKQAALESGQADEIRQSCYDHVKQYDEFRYLTLESFDFRFDTKEYVDEHFQGSLFYYFR